MTSPPSFRRTALGPYLSLARIALALRRSRTPILVIVAVYLTSVATGMLMVHAGNFFALAYRDSLVAKAQRADPSSVAHRSGRHGLAAAIDFSRNLGVAAIPETVLGLTLVVPVGLAAYRGWVGGIVSVDAQHESRLRRPRPAIYYLVTMALHLSAFSLAGGAGLRLGTAFWRRQGPFVGPTWLGLPREASADVLWLYVLIVPLFALGSSWEFLWPAA